MIATRVSSVTVVGPRTEIPIDIPPDFGDLEVSIFRPGLAAPKASRHPGGCLRAREADIRSWRSNGRKTGSAR